MNLIELFERSKCCIVGIPDHQAVFHVGGRVGAQRGPFEFRKVFSRMVGRHSLAEYLKDAGDVPGLGSDVALNHQQVANFIKPIHDAGALSVVVGGGHDHGYSHLLGVSKGLSKKNKKLRLGCINIDAHFDVRKPKPLITSGSPFYLALESRVLDPTRFIEFGIQSHCNAPEYWDYVESKKVQVVRFDQLRRGNAVSLFSKHLKNLASCCDAVVISLDLDALASAYSPGVSAPQAEGFTAMEVIEMMEVAGRERKTVSLGIFELNPEFDVDQRSARLAATAAFHFIEAAFLREKKR